MDHELAMTLPGISRGASEARSAPLVVQAPKAPLQGSVLVLIQFDVCEEIRLDKLRDIFGARTADASFKHQAPGYVRYQRPPVEENIEPLVLDSGERLQVEIKYFDYGVVSVVFELSFAGDATEWLQEDYFIFHVREIAGEPSASDLLAAHGGRIAQVVRGETATLSDGEREEILQSQISYYPNDLAVIGWNAAFIYDTPAGAETAIQLLQYANSQLLEFRHYDDLLTRELEGVYDFLDKGVGLWSRWRTANAATKLHTVLLDVAELTERADNAIKFLSDMFSARLYKLAASRVGVPDYKDLVQQKLNTAEDLYHFMVDQFNQSRAFVLELMVVIILIIELIWVFRGKPL